MKTLFLLQIVKPNGDVVRLPAGGALEIDLIEAVAAAVSAKSVGVGRTRAHVAAAVREAMTETLAGLKRQTVAVV